MYFVDFPSSAKRQTFEEFCVSLVSKRGASGIARNEICSADGGQVGNQFALQIGYINFPNVNCLSVFPTAYSTSPYRK